MSYAGPSASRVGASAVVARLRRRIAGVMGYSDDGAVDTAKPLTEMGLDSLMAVRMRNTIRGDFGLETQENLVHGSDSAESAAREMAIWFPGLDPQPTA